MITPDEIKRGLELCEADECQEEQDTRCPYAENAFCVTHLFGDALAYINQLEARVTKWISVKDRKPEGVVLVANFAPGTDGYKKMDVADVFDAGNSDITFYLLNGFDVEYNVTHWMPIPDAPPEKG